MIRKEKGFSQRPSSWVIYTMSNSTISDQTTYWGRGMKRKCAGLSVNDLPRGDMTLEDKVSSLVHGLLACQRNEQPLCSLQVIYNSSRHGATVFMPHESHSQPRITGSLLILISYLARETKLLLFERVCTVCVGMLAHMGM